MVGFWCFCYCRCLPSRGRKRREKESWMKEMSEVLVMIMIGLSDSIDGDPCVIVIVGDHASSLVCFCETHLMSIKGCCFILK